MNFSRLIFVNYYGLKTWRQGSLEFIGPSFPFFIMDRKDVDFEKGLVTQRGEDGDLSLNRSMNTKLVEAEWSVLFPEFRRVLGEARDLDDVYMLKAKVRVCSESYRQLTELMETRRQFLEEDVFCKEFVKLKSAKFSLDEAICRLEALVESQRDIQGVREMEQKTI